MARGLNRQVLFFDDEDRVYFFWVLNQAKEKFGFICHCYCLMDNHYHLFVQTPFANLSKMMKFINETFAVYFLKKHPEKDGHVFKGRYRKKVVQEKLYAWQLMRYIHLNPVKAKLVFQPEEWRWSSYRAFIGLEKKKRFLELDWLSQQFSKNKDKAKKLIADHTYEGIKHDWDPEKESFAKTVLGSEEFYSSIIERFGPGIAKDETIGAVKYQIKRNVEPEDIFSKVNEMNVDLRLKEKLLIYYLKEYSSLSLEQIGQLTNKQAKTVSKSYGRTKKMLMEKRRDLIKVGEGFVELSNVEVRPR